MLSNLQQVNYGQLWMDIEQCDNCWYIDLNQNEKYVQNATEAAQKFFANEGKNRKVGIYTSVYEWQKTVGGSSAFSHLQLWYAHYDNLPSFSDSWVSTWDI